MVKLTVGQIEHHNDIKKQIAHWQAATQLWQSSRDDMLRAKNRDPNAAEPYPPQSYIDDFVRLTGDLRIEDSRLTELETVQLNTPDGPENIEPYLPPPPSDKDHLAHLEQTYDNLSKHGPDGHTIAPPDQLDALDNAISDTEKKTKNADDAHDGRHDSSRNGDRRSGDHHGDRRNGDRHGRSNDD